MHEYSFLTASSLTVRPVGAGYLPDLQATCCIIVMSHTPLSENQGQEGECPVGLTDGRWLIAQGFPHPSINQILGEIPVCAVSAVPAGLLPATAQGPGYHGSSAANSSQGLPLWELPLAARGLGADQSLYQ